MAVANMELVQEALKLFYLPGLRYQLATATPTLAELEKTSDGVVGSEVVMALRYGRHGGTGNRTDDGTLPTPNPRKTKQARFPLKNFFAHIQITDKVIKASRNNDGAFANMLDTELSDALDDSRDNINRQIFGDGSGKMAVITAASWADNVLTLTVSSTLYFAEGQLLDIIDVSGNTVLANGSELEVLVVDDDASQIRLKCPNNIASAIEANNDFLTIAGSWNMEITGFGAVFTPDTTLYGIDRSQNKWMNPTIIHVNGEISESKLQEGVHTVDRKAGGIIDFWVASLGVSRAYGDLLLASRQLVNPGTVKLEGGYEVVTFRGKPFVEDRYAPPETLYGLQRETWRVYQLDEPDWLDRDGAILSRLETKPVWAATLAWYLELGCSKVRGNAIFTGIREH